jgi:DNA-binding response OmpR family regulator
MSDAPQTLWYVFDEPTRILVVDDDPILCEFASVYLTTPMSKVVSTLDSSAALDLLMREQFDVALVDIAMPGMDGFELVERIRGQEKLRGLPIVIVTGREDVVSIDRAYSVGATSFVTKPVNWRQLSHQLRYVVRASRGQAATARPHDDGGPSSGRELAWMSNGTRREFTTSLGSIINAAKRIANGRAPSEAAAQEIITTAETLLLKSLVTREDGRALKFLPSTQPPPRAG